MRDFAQDRTRPSGTRQAIKTTPRERAFIDALAVYYRDFRAQAERTKAYEAAMEKLSAT